MTSGTTVDVLIVGAGIHGAAVAHLACQRGLSALVIERREAAGLETSSNSSKLIHGGLRYLETGQIKLVYECLAERRFLLRHVPEWVSEKDFYIPVYSSSQKSPIWITMGLALYSLLGGGGFQRFGKRKRQAEIKKLGLKEGGLLGLLRYRDAQTDDCALTQWTLAEALRLGCQVRFNSGLMSCRRLEHSSIASGGFSVTLSTGEEVTARALVNAAGPWVNQMAGLIPGAGVKPIRWVQGTHLLLDRPAKPGCVYCEAPSDGRAVFVLPWQGKMLVGTTETERSQPKAEVEPTEVTYLLEVVNNYFPDLNCREQDILRTYCGVRVLPQAETGVQSANRASRETVYAVDAEDSPRYVGIYGGKLTSHRATAKQVLRILAKGLGG